ncbi:hypothetical protein [Paenibacillus cremeus]|uniref:Uncharacterized protein n=1 Tax=Paenibacillus cremeus TaxID=2163881 RepID=A0A559KBB1_9BACL|nr:hypothetical protein [Paenibacillus cremeus]TVY09415.1 hypothetical protein FPZ49_13270 [Paenibacillus cremeus]
MKNNVSPRRTRAYISAFTTTQIHLRNPWVVTFFAFSFPGFGNLLLHRYAKAFTLISWEVFINTHAKVNLGILYSMTGHFAKAKEVLDPRWLIIYVGIYMYSIWDGYRSTMDINKQFLLADHENAKLTPSVMSAWDINFLDKKAPFVALAWSLLVPGLGHLYIHHMITGFFLFGWTIAIMYFSHIPEAINLSMIGDFAGAKAAVDMQWLLYLPSILCFVFYDAYVSTVESNKLFELEQVQHLKQQYQSPQFQMPI